MLRPNSHHTFGIGRTVAKEYELDPNLTTEVDLVFATFSTSMPVVRMPHQQSEKRLLKSPNTSKSDTSVVSFELQ